MEIRSAAKKRHSTNVLSSSPLVHSKTGAFRCGQTSQRCVRACMLILVKEISANELLVLFLSLFVAPFLLAMAFFLVLSPRHPRSTFFQPRPFSPPPPQKKTPKNSAFAIPTTRASARPSATTTSSASTTGRRSRGSTRSTGSRRRRTRLLQQLAETRAGRRQQTRSIK